MLNLEKIPDQVGYLVMTEDGSVLTSGGALQNNQVMAEAIFHLVSVSDKVDPTVFQPGEGFKRISLVYENFSYVICLSNKRIFVVKRKVVPNPVEAVVV